VIEVVVVVVVVVAPFFWLAGETRTDPGDPSSHNPRDWHARPGQGGRVSRCSSRRLVQP